MFQQRKTKLMRVINDKYAGVKHKLAHYLCILNEVNVIQKLVMLSDYSKYY